jgi:cytochrome c biogenesis protein CcmG/thiol:disulfide interchange protein DsbE
MKRNLVLLAVLIAAITIMLTAGKYATRGTVRAGISGSGDLNGQVAPDFQLKDVSGKTVRLADLRGKAVLLNFWATWCPPCKVEIPWFVELQKQYGPEGLQVIGVSMDENGEELVSKYVAEAGINYPILMGNDEVGDAYGGIHALPTTFYIGRDGKVVRRVFGLASHKEVEQNVRAALSQGDSKLAESK